MAKILEFPKAPWINTQHERMEDTYKKLNDAIAQNEKAVEKINFIYDHTPRYKFIRRMRIKNHLKKLDDQQRKLIEYLGEMQALALMQGYVSMINKKRGKS